MVLLGVTTMQAESEAIGAEDRVQTQREFRFILTRIQLLDQAFLEVRA